MRYALFDNLLSLKDVAWKLSKYLAEEAWITYHTHVFFNGLVELKIIKNVNRFAHVWRAYFKNMKAFLGTTDAFFRKASICGKVILEKH